MKKVPVLSLAVGALVLGAPSTHASHELHDCQFVSVDEEAVTGGQDTVTGTVVGYVVSTRPENVAIRCYFRVNGVDVAGTPPQFGIQLVATAGQVTYTAAGTDVVQLCHDWYTDTHGWQTQCHPTTTTQIPPQEVLDLVERLRQAVADVTAPLDLLLCPLFASLSPGVPGVVDVDTEGDVAVAGIGVWDCPPDGV